MLRWSRQVTRNPNHCAPSSAMSGRSEPSAGSRGFVRAGETGEAAQGVRRQRTLTLVECLDEHVDEPGQRVGGFIARVAPRC